MKDLNPRQPPCNEEALTTELTRRLNAQGKENRTFHMGFWRPYRQPWNMPLYFTDQFLPYEQNEVGSDKYT